MFKVYQNSSGLFLGLDRILTIIIIVKIKDASNSIKPFDASFMRLLLFR